MRDLVDQLPNHLQPHDLADLGGFFFKLRSHNGAASRFAIVAPSPCAQVAGGIDGALRSVYCGKVLVGVLRVCCFQLFIDLLTQRGELFIDLLVVGWRKALTGVVATAK